MCGSAGAQETVSGDFTTVDLAFGILKENLRKEPRFSYRTVENNPIGGAGRPGAWIRSDGAVGVLDRSGAAPEIEI